VLIGDDGVRLVRDGNSLIASPPPNIGGLIEIRNVGLVPLPTTSAPLCIVADLATNAPRLPEKTGEFLFAGLSIPQLTLYPDSPALALRAHWALRQYGIAF